MHLALNNKIRSQATDGGHLIMMNLLLRYQSPAAALSLSPSLSFGSLLIFFTSRLTYNDVIVTLKSFLRPLIRRDSCLVCLMRHHLQIIVSIILALSLSHSCASFFLFFKFQQIHFDAQNSRKVTLVRLQMSD